MVVMWVTRDPVNTTVKYGLSSGSYEFSADGTRDTYNVGVFGKIKNLIFFFFSTKKI